MDIGKRIKECRIRKKLTQRDLAKKINVSPQVVSNWERDYTAPDFSDIAKMASVFDTTTDYLINGSLNQLTPFSIDDPDLVRIPILGSIRAGRPMDRIEYIEGYELAERDAIRGRKAFILSVRGDSMIGDHIFDGDRVVVVVQEEVSPSDIAVVAVNGDDATLKRVKFFDGKCLLIPSNTAMKIMEYPASDVHVIGKVIESRRKRE